MKRKIFCAAILLSFSVIACDNQKKSNSEQLPVDLSVKKTTNSMNSFVSIFEIPATEISRAVGFYQEILAINIDQMDVQGMQMGIFPYEGQMITGVIIKGDGYRPSADGVTIYLNGGDNLQIILDKVEKNGGKIVVPKTLHADESGYFAMFLDTEGNKIGLHSPN
jgi:predicted enzyme related to lactoylglutathione lyase